MAEVAADLGVSIERLPARASRRRLNGSAYSSTTRRVVQIRASEQARVVDEAEAALIAAEAPVYVRAGQLVRPILEEALAASGRTTVVGRIKALCLDSLTDLLGRVATFQRYSDQRSQWFKVDPPRWVASMLLARDGEWLLPPLAGVITTPTLRPDGSLLSEAGYDCQATRQTAPLTT